MIRKLTSQIEDDKMIAELEKMEEVRGLGPTTSTHGPSACTCFCSSSCGYKTGTDSAQYSAQKTYR